MHGTILSPFELGDNLCDILDKVRSIPGKKKNMENIFVTIGSKVNSNSQPLTCNHQIPI